MKDYIIQTAAGAAGAVFSFLYGEVDAVFYVLIALMVIDFASGLTNAALQKNMDSEVCFRGIARKVYILVLVAMGHLIDTALGITVAMNVIMFFYIANESISITENAGKMGLPVPQRILDILEQLKSENDKGGEDDGNGLD